MQARNERLGALHGLPVAHKDLVETRGIRTTFGSLLYKDNVPTEDDIVVDRMRQAGAQSLGPDEDVRGILRRRGGLAGLRTGAGCEWLRARPEP